MANAIDLAVGNEPEVSVGDMFSDRKMLLIKSLNWYSKNWDSKSAKIALVDFFIRKGKDTKKVSKIPVENVCLTFGALARLEERGLDLTDKECELIYNYVSNYVIPESVTIEVSKESPKQEVDEKVNNTLDLLESSLEKIVQGTSQNELKYVESVIESAHLTKAQKAKIVEWINQDFPHIKSAVEKTDEEEIESYSGLSVKIKRLILTWYDNLLTLLTTTNVNVPEMPKTKADRYKAAEHIRYHKDSLVKPHDLFGKKVLWVYNEEKRHLIKITSTKGINVYRMKLLDCIGVSKNIRKPEMIDEFIKLSAKAKVKYFSEIKSKEQEHNCRLGDVNNIIIAGE